MKGKLIGLRRREHGHEKRVERTGGMWNGFLFLGRMPGFRKYEE
jgi:hypothetical protein